MFAAFFADVFSALKAYLLANGLTLAAHVTPYILFLAVVLPQFELDTAWGKFVLVCTLLATGFLAADLAGKIPAITIPATPSES